MKLDFKVTIEFQGYGDDEQCLYCPYVTEAIRCFIDSYVKSVHAALKSGTIYFKDKSVHIGSTQTLEEMFRQEAIRPMSSPRL